MRKLYTFGSPRRDPRTRVVTGGRSTRSPTIEGRDSLQVQSEMNDGGVVFADGIEEDRLTFAWGVRADVAVARERLRLAVGPPDSLFRLA